MHNSHVTVRQESVVFSEFINQTLIITDVAEDMYRFEEHREEEKARSKDDLGVLLKRKFLFARGGNARFYFSQLPEQEIVIINLT